MSWVTYWHFNDAASDRLMIFSIGVAMTAVGGE